MSTDAMATLHIRHFVRRDMPEVLAIEADSFEFPWSKGDFARVLRQNNTVFLVAEHDDHVVGFMLHEICKSGFHVINLAVATGFLRVSVGRQLIEKLVGQLSALGRTRILLEVRETNLDAQLFFRDSGFRAVSVLTDFYDHTPEDAYVMEYRLQPQGPAAFVPVNRIAGMIA